MNGNKIVWTERIAINLLRIVAGFLFWQHGVQKLFGVLGRDAPVEFFSLPGLAGVLETVGGALLVLGIFTRPVAFILSGEMAWAYFSAHAPNGFWPIMNRGELAALYSFLFLYLAARGGGAFSVDGLLKLARRRRARPGEVEGDEEEGRRGKKDDFPELTEDDLKEDPEIAELLGDNP
jgi:putative oxidoreductase